MRLQDILHPEVCTLFDEGKAPLHNVVEKCRVDHYNIHQSITELRA